MPRGDGFCSLKEPGMSTHFVQKQYVFLVWSGLMTASGRPSALSSDLKHVRGESPQRRGGGRGHPDACVSVDLLQTESHGAIRPSFVRELGVCFRMLVNVCFETSTCF